MRRRFFFRGALAIGVAIVVIAGRGWRRRPKPATGTFSSGIAYARFGTGPKPLLWLARSEGPPGGLDLMMMWPTLRPFVEHGYSAWVLSNPRNMPKGHTLADMADDYADLIAEEFGGKADLVIGHSTGGMIGFYLAAQHPDRFGHITVAGAACEWREELQAGNLEFARLLAAGRKREAAAFLLSSVSNMPPALVKLLAAGLARVFFSAPVNPSDVMITAQALGTFDGRKILPEIAVPVLLVGADQDFYFPEELMDETARLIPNCTYKLYRDKNHLQTIYNKQFPKDVLQFLQR
jgi:pimeloyl-ACP methyl ester carboxylesterase